MHFATTTCWIWSCFITKGVALQRPANHHSSTLHSSPQVLLLPTRLSVSIRTDGCNPRNNPVEFAAMESICARVASAASRAAVGRACFTRTSIARSASSILLRARATSQRPGGMFVRWMARDNTKDVNPELSERWAACTCGCYSSLSINSRILGAHALCTTQP